MGDSHDDADPRLRLGWLERVCELVCECVLVVMVVMIGVDVIARTGFGISFEISDEIGAYLLVAITFFSMSVCLATGAFHRVEIIQAKLSPAVRSASMFSFEVLALVCALVVLWQLVRLEWITWNSGDTAATWLMTPLWLPRLPMALGMLALVIGLAKAALAELRGFVSIRERQRR
jgi:TRAP-type C4-dicarboxylate transport system permease small subunit